MKDWIALTSIVCAMAGCATQDQLRQTEAQQGQAVQALRAGVNRSESDTADLRAEIRRTQQSVQGLEVALTDARARTDAAKAQADNALSTSREFLANLIGAREEQRRQLYENGIAFAELKRKFAELDSRLQAQQRLLEQNVSASNDGNRRLMTVEAGLQEAGRRSASLEARAKTLQEADDGLTRQIGTLRKQVEDTRAVLSSEGLLQMMRDLEGVRRSSASLRGSIDELQKAQADSAAQVRNYYLDLDSRVRRLQQPASQAVNEIDTRAQSMLEPAAAAEQTGSQ
jgi:chromosome segregation ATPase